ncbi:hypothetical protein MPNT_60096 [Candidatus Methylacidithermus pantelleriae]|uniref:Uncharacterized protein n=1 Tax=Candidatus Methylacidithermus pantelleriae TaxID=2744239 RepID=A0A8J2BSA6_9BACT|nr:hypothetical protein MPNT_60096 [Candidatus Methylacidithermus pantelleriae]
MVPCFGSKRSGFRAGRIQDAREKSWSGGIERKCAKRLWHPSGKESRGYPSERKEVLRKARGSSGGLEEMALCVGECFLARGREASPDHSFFGKPT